MRRLTTIFCLAIFVASFLIASVDYFNDVAYPPDARFAAILKITALAAIAGIALSEFFAQLNIIQIKQFFLRAPLGILIGVVLFWGIFFSEHVMSTIRLKRAIRDPDVFAVVRGHCGVYSGRGLVRWYKESLGSDLNKQLASFNFSNQCRIDHFLDLRRTNQINCMTDEDPMACLSRWMLTFSKRGYWNLPTRKMFFEEAKANADGDKKWISFALRDYELELSHPNMIQQAGIQEDFNDLHHYHKLKEEYDNLLLTKEIFAHVEKRVKDDRSAEVQKFKETRKEVNLKLERIPELEVDIRNTKEKIQL